MKYINGVSQKDVEDKSLVAVEFEDDYGRCWMTYRGEELHDALEGRDDISDVDLVWWEDQPEELMPFYKWYGEHERELRMAGIPFSKIFEMYGTEDKEVRI